MKKLNSALAIALMFTSAATAAPTLKSGSKIMSSEQAAAMSPLQDYIRAQETGNSDFVRRAFDKDAKVTGYMGGKMIAWSVDEYAARFSGKPAVDEAQRKRSIEILDLTADAAVGKVVLDYPTVKFTDYMSLLKIDGVWKIANKSFNAEMKPAK
jgi:Putative lumazine-binding